MRVTLGITQTVVGQKPFSISLAKDDFRHALLLGKSGTGKSTLLRNLIAAVLPNHGLCVLDPHGDLIYDIFNYIPENRLKDIVYLDPENLRIPDIGILDHPDKARALRVFMTLMEAHAKEGWGKQTASILRNITRAALEVFAHPSILHLYLLLADDDYANAILGKAKNPVTQRWYKQQFLLKQKDRIEKWSHPLNKIEELMEPGLVEFLAQEKSLRFRKLMDDQKIILCRIPKSYLEERGARILGSFIMMKLKIEATRRKRRKRQFFVIADEFHNFTGGIDVDTTFGESRKYGVHYIVASQTRKQLQDNAEVIEGNVSHIFAFRMNAPDAKSILENLGDDDNYYRQIVLLPNFTFRALTMDSGQPTPSEPVALYEFPETAGDEVPARKAIAWAKANTGTPKSEIQKHIEKTLRN